MAGKSNSDVEALDIYDQSLIVIPEELANIFPNLRYLGISRSNLLSIKANDLKFPKLNILLILSNQIAIIDGNLFTFTRNLQWIFFNDNRIQNVGENLLAGLTALKQADFRDEICINQSATTPEAIQKLNLQLPISCSCDGRINSLRDEMMKIFEMQANRIVDLEKQMRECACS
jgi:Leucine-rich repeat (LRR) protein